MKLAHLIEERRDEKLPIVPLPGKEEIGQRKLIANYAREVKCRTRLLNQLHAMYVHQGHTTIVRKDMATSERRQEAVELLTGQEREEAEWILKHLDLYEKRIKELKDKMIKETKNIWR